MSGEDHTLTVPVAISTKEPLSLTDNLEKTLKQYDVDAAAAAETKRLNALMKPISPTAAFSWEDLQVVNSPKLVSVAETKATGLWATVITAVLGGFVSLLTPCVFPMIPVTVSFFLKQGERNHHRPLTMAAVYCATIVTVLTIGGMGLVHVLQVISQHWITNLFLTGVFVFFALSLLGMYEIALPSSLANLTGAGRQGRPGRHRVHGLDVQHH